LSDPGEEEALKMFEEVLESLNQPADKTAMRKTSPFKEGKP